MPSKLGDIVYGLNLVSYAGVQRLAAMLATPPIDTGMSEMPVVDSKKTEFEEVALEVPHDAPKVEPEVVRMG
jgi:hypothetical protein